MNVVSGLKTNLQLIPDSLPDSGAGRGGDATCAVACANPHVPRMRLYCTGFGKKDLHDGARQSESERASGFHETFERVINYVIYSISYLEDNLFLLN